MPKLTIRRYITQLRYGCQDVHCNIPTCFSCRKRSAGSKPLRRYNATSARTLACFLASRDNPEKGLCQAFNLPRKTSRHSRISSITRTSLEHPGDDGAQPKTGKTQSSHRSRSAVSKGAPDSPRATNPDIYTNGTKSRTRNEQAEISTEKLNTESLHPTLEQPLKKDHKSFVQNMFGTVAFRMIEWLTPINLEAMIRADSSIHDLPFPDNGTEGATDVKKSPELVSHPRDGSLSPSQESRLSDHSSAGLNFSQPSEMDMPLSPDRSTLPGTLDGQIDPTTDSTLRRRTSNQPANRNRRSRDVEDATNQQIPLPSTIHRGASVVMEKDRESIEHGFQRNGINTQMPKTQDNDLNRRLTLDNQETASPKKTRRRAPSNVSSKTVADQNGISPYGGISPTLPLLSPRLAIITPTATTERNDGTNYNLLNGKPPASEEKVPATTSTHRTALVELPKTLTSLSIEIIDLFYNILQEDGRFDLKSKSLGLSIYNEYGLRRRRHTGDDDRSMNPESPQPIAITRLPDTAPLWRLFIEQSLFVALSSHDNLSCSFRDGGRLFDTQTLWYCMAHLIQYFPTLVFDSLWISAAELYSIPLEVKPFLDPPNRNGHEKEIFSFKDAADTMSLCLHALIAAVPYVRDPSDLFSISRIRSFGLSTSQGRRMSKELAQLCLLYDDVFSDEMALRLARRVFAAIPAIRLHQVVLALNNPSESSSHRPDILELVLAPLNFLDIEILPILDFSAEERHLHEKRAPTLLIDWARTVMLKDWNGLPVVPSHGSFGGALALMQAIRTLFTPISL